jgi:hypothetical protein
MPLLTKDLLDLWKELVTKNISKDYFDKHFTVTSIQGEYWGDGRDEYVVRIYYKFNYGLIRDTTKEGNSWMLFTVARKANNT